ncbi:MAG: fibronectin type III domain-containing protein [Thermoplasmata archaeon]|nr:fibronectin type III domain-containing protein [Thermoplasmata archaeon]
MPRKQKAYRLLAIVLLLCIPFFSSAAEGATSVELDEPGDDDIGKTSVYLSWSRSDDGDNFLKYEVYAGEKGKGFILRHTITEIDTTNYKVAGLKEDTKYEFKIVDWDKDGYQLDSNYVDAKTEAIPGFDAILMALALVIAVIFISVAKRRKRSFEDKP